jgi:hypothetical protein
VIVVAIALAVIWWRANHSAPDITIRVDSVRAMRAPGEVASAAGIEAGALT